MNVARSLVRTLWPAALVVAVQLVAFPLPAGVWLQGLVLGLLNALVVLGLALVYRANRVVNLAQASIGLYPATIAGALVLFGAPGAAATGGLGAAAALVALVSARTVLRWPWVASVALAAAVGGASAAGLYLAPGLGWFGGLLAGLAVAVLSGAAVHAVVIRRLRRSPRLVVTVATIGLAQLFAVGALLAPRMWNVVALVDPAGDRTGFEVPGGFTLTVGDTVFRSAEVLAVVVAVAMMAGVGAALRWTRLGMAVRASADRADRASMLGVPVPRVEAGAWVLAAVLAFVASYLQAGILGLEITSGVGLRVLVAALGAMALGGFGTLPAMLAAGVAIGVLEQATGPAGGHSLTLTDAVLAAVVIVGLLLRRSSTRRSDRETTSSWQALAEPRAVPFELATVGSLVWARRIAVVVTAGLVIALPLVLGESGVLRASTVVALALVGVSVVVLTGWTGEVTLGQMAFAAVGAAVAAAATEAWRFDLSLALLVGGGAGGLAALVVALPSLRWQGIFLAVTTLAFALASINYLLNPTIATWIPTGDLARRPLFGIVDLSGRTAMYEVAVVVVIACLVGVVGVRRSRVGRVLRAVRDNPAAAQAMGVRVPLARVVAFALSGFLAGVGGGLLFAINERYDVGVFSATEGLNVFIAAVVGGVGSLLGAVVGTVVFQGARIFASGPAGLLPSAVGVLVVLLLLPGGLAEVAYRVRDRLLRRWSASRGIEVPSLVADRRAAEATDQPRPAATAEAGWLSVRGVDVAYDRVQVLFGVDLDVACGEITALLGTNGAGKSTLLRAIGGVAPITAGTIKLGDLDLTALRPEQIPLHGIAQMPGGQGVFPSLTVEENLQVAAWLVPGGRSEVHRRIDAARAQFAVLEQRSGDRAADLSGGQQQQLALAMALLAEPDVLLIDELSLGLAPVVVAELLAEVRRLRDQGTTVVIVEQSVELALSVADHAVFLEKGEVRYAGPAAELLDRPDLVRAVYLHGAQAALATDGHVDRPSAPTAGPATDQPAADPVAPTSQPVGPAPELVVETLGGGDHPQQVREHALEARDLTVAFGGITAVDHVDLTVGAGEVVGLIGPNGAGKTTLFDLISGFTGADAGTVLVHGADLSRRPPSDRSRAGIGRSFQDARLFPGLTVAEAIAVALERWVQGDDVVSAAFRLPPSRLASRQVSDRTDELIDVFGLAAFRSKRVGDLSTGSRRMVDLACVVAHGPSVVLLDEPTSGIAQREAEALGPVLLGLRDRLDASLLVIEHDIALISSIASRLVALDQGRVVTSGPPAEVLEHADVVASYLGGDPVTRERSRHGGER